MYLLKTGGPSSPRPAKLVERGRREEDQDVSSLWQVFRNPAVTTCVALSGNCNMKPLLLLQVKRL